MRLSDCSENKRLLLKQPIIVTSLECASSACAFEGGSKDLPLTHISLCEALKARNSKAQGKAAKQTQPWG